MLDGYAFALLYSQLNLDWIFDTAGSRLSSVVFRAGQYFDFIIVNAKNAAT